MPLTNSICIQACVILCWRWPAEEAVLSEPVFLVMMILIWFIHLFNIRLWVMMTGDWRRWPDCVTRRIPASVEGLPIDIPVLTIYSDDWMEAKNDERAWLEEGLKGWYIEEAFSDTAFQRYRFEVLFYSARFYSAIPIFGLLFPVLKKIRWYSIFASLTIRASIRPIWW